MKLIKLLSLSLIAACVCSAVLPGTIPSASAAGTIIRVSIDGADNAPTCGLNWATPCDLEYALASRVSEGDEIWVKAGTYTPSGTDEASQSFHLASGVGLYGGFSGNETERSQRDWENNPTLLQGIHVLYRHIFVIQSDQTSEATVLDGFTVTGDMGLNVEDGYLTLRNMIFRDNMSDNSGPAGITNFNGTITIENSQFINNHGYMGAAISSGSGFISIKDSLFQANVSSEGYGGVIYNAHSNHIEIENSSFIENSAESGGVIFNDESTVTFTNCLFSGNSASDFGGAIANSYGSTTNIINSTFHQNTAVQPDASIHSYSSTLNIRNSIVWGAQSSPIYDEGGYSPITVSRSIINGGYPGTGNIDADPILGTIGDYGGATPTLPIAEDSPARDAIPAEYCTGPDGQPLQNDQRGALRPQGAGCDIGSFEIQGDDVVLLRNSLATLPAGMPVMITQDHLRISHPSDPPEALTFTLAQLPAHGRLRLDGADLQLNDTFTQKDINEGNLVYYNDSSTPGPDGFGFLFSSSGQPAVERVSVGSGGQQANDQAANAKMSPDGQYFIFESAATNLAGMDTYDAEQVYLRDHLADQTSLISIAPDGTAAQANTMVPAISPDGRFTAFSSNATNLGYDLDPSSILQLYLQDHLQPSLEQELISINSSGMAGDGISYFASISRDGRYVAFFTEAQNLIEIEQDESTADIPILRDRSTNQNHCISKDASGICRAAYAPVLSGDGQWVAFATDSSLRPEDLNTYRDVYLYHTVDESLILASIGSDGQSGNHQSGSSPLSISEDGRYVVYGSDASNLVAEDTNEEADIFLFDRQAGTNELVTINSKQEQGVDHQFAIPGPAFAVSTDGRYVVFISSASNLDSWDTNGHTDLFIRDRHHQTTNRIILPDSPNGSLPLFIDNTYSLNISSDGKKIFFGSEANWLVSGDTNAALDYFIVKPAQQAFFNIQVDSPALLPQVKKNTGLVAFWEQTTGITADQLAASSSLPAGRSTFTMTSLPELGTLTLNDLPLQIGDTYTQEDVDAGNLAFHAMDLGASHFDFSLGFHPLIQRISTDPQGQASPDADFWYPSISYDGRYTPVLLREGNDTVVYIRDLETQQYERIAPGLYAVISGNGQYILFVSNSPDIIPGVPPAYIGQHLYRYDRVSKTYEIVDVDPNGNPSPQGVGDNISISFDGQKVLFHSQSSLLPSTPDYSTYVRDMRTGSLEVASIDIHGNPIALYWGQISGDGRYAVFDDFVRDLNENTTQTLSFLKGHAASSSYDGRWIVSIIEDDIIPGDTNGFTDIAVYDQVTGSYTLLSVPETGGLANRESILPTISPEGRFVSFSTIATNLNGAPDSSIGQVVWHDRLTSETIPISVSAGGQYGDDHSAYTALPVGGQRILFASLATNLVPQESEYDSQYMVDLAHTTASFQISVEPPCKIFIPLILN